MNAVYIDSKLSDAERRKEIYHGQLFVYSPLRATEQFCAFTRDLIREAFDPFDPEFAQREIPVEKYVEVLTELKPAFIHHPKSKEFIRAMLEQSGCDLGKTYFDVPRLRTSTSDNYLTSGIAYAFHPHRDTWYSAPFSQINWWLPVFEMEVGNGFAIHPKYWNTAVTNSSYRFAYSQWVQEGRKNSARNILTDERVQPRAMEPLELTPQLRVVLKPGASLLFSAAHLHSSVPNFTGKTRFSIDFRTVNYDDVIQGCGAPNIDSACEDLTLGDFVRASDFAPFPKEVIERVSNKSKPLVEVA
jgi:hypothetical protein